MELEGVDSVCVLFFFIITTLCQNFSSRGLDFVELRTTGLQDKCVDYWIQRCEHGPLVKSLLWAPVKMEALLQPGSGETGAVYDRSFQLGLTFISGMYTQESPLEPPAPLVW